MPDRMPMSSSTRRTSMVWLPTADRGTNDGMNWWIAVMGQVSPVAGAGHGEARRAEQGLLDAGQVGVEGGVADRLEGAGGGAVVALEPGEAPTVEEVQPRRRVQRLARGEVGLDH